MRRINVKVKWVVAKCEIRKVGVALLSKKKKKRKKKEKLTKTKSGRIFTAFESC